MELVEHRRTRLPADERRALIVAAARSLFARNGFHATGTNEIAAAAGCSEPIIYRHFRSKQALFGAALEDAARQIRARVDANDALPGETPFDAYVRLMRDLIADPLFAEASRLRLLAVSLADDPEVNAALRTVSKLHRERACGVVQTGKDDGSIRADIDGGMVAMVLFGLGLASSFKLAIDGEDALAGFPALLDSFVSLIRPHHEESQP